MPVSGPTAAPTADLVAAARTLATAARGLERALGDITLPQYRVLALVASSPERAGRIAEKAAVSRPSLSGLLDGLVARGWVRRVEVDHDRRGVRLEVTASGRRALRHADAAAAARLGEVLDRLPGGGPTVVLVGLHHLAAALATTAAAAHAETVRP